MNWTAPNVVICPANPSCLPIAKSLAQQFGLTLLDAVPAEHAQAVWTLTVNLDAVTLARPDGLSTSIDFVRGKATQRAQEAGFKSQPLARALGLRQLRKRKDAQPTVIDATAGFGTDGWMIASLDCQVRLLETSPMLCAMLTHALTAAGANHRLAVVNTNSVDYLMNLDHSRADIIYLDPMYPQTRSTALVKKGMQLLHDLIGPDENGALLLRAALSKADYRVVVKRPRGAPQLDGSDSWSGQITAVQSPHTRFDVYHIASV